MKNFLSNIDFQKVSVEDINNLINSVSGSSIEILTQPAIEMKDISLAIPIPLIENRSITKKLAKKVINKIV